VVFGDYIPPSKDAACCAGCNGLGELRRRRRVTGGRAALHRASGHRSGAHRGGVHGLGGLGQEFYSAAGVEAAVAQADGEIMALSREVTAHWSGGRLRTAEFKPFQSFVKEWMGFRDSVGIGSKLFPGLSGTIEKVNEYAQRAREWYGRFTDKGLGFSTPPPRKRKRKPGVSSLIKWAVVGVVALAMAPVLGAVVGLIPRGRS
jgi:hypothetical protein